MARLTEFNINKLIKIIADYGVRLVDKISQCLKYKVLLFYFHIHII